jgi:hypothetical protein
MADASKQTNPWKIGCLILAIGIVLWAGYGLIVTRIIPDWRIRSQFGDMLGGIGALFSGLALAGVVVAIKMQREELELQAELVATRDELKRSTEAQTARSQALATQIEVIQLSLN